VMLEPQSKRHKEEVEDERVDNPQKVAKRHKIIAPSFSKQSLNPVVKVYSIVIQPDYSLPWQKKRQTKSTSSGFVIEGHRILTNAHSVADFKSLRVRKHGCAKKYTATTVHIGHTCDIAMLTVEDPKFWENLPSVSFGEIPNLLDSVTVIGYPTGGDNISVTGGVVSRVELTQYSHADTELLAIQIDAAINPGNSGGPALNSAGEVIGIAFETLVDAENIGYIIPVPVIHHFLEDIERHRAYTGFPDFLPTYQPLENDSLRHYLGVSSDQTGILVGRVPNLGHIAGVLKKGDVLLSVDGVQIGDDASITFREGERVSFRYLFQRKFLGDESELVVLRDKQLITLKLILQEPTYLVPPYEFDVDPSFFVHAGLLFIPLTRPYLHDRWGTKWDTKAPVGLVDKAMNGTKQFLDQQVVVLSQILINNTNFGYPSMAHLQLLYFNGEKVRNMAHLIHLQETSNADFHRFEFEYDRMLVLDRKEAEEATEATLTQNNIPRAKSLNSHSPLTWSENDIPNKV